MVDLTSKAFSYFPNKKRVFNIHSKWALEKMRQSFLKRKLTKKKFYRINDNVDLGEKGGKNA